MASHNIVFDAAYHCRHLYFDKTYFVKKTSHDVLVPHRCLFAVKMCNFDDNVFMKNFVLGDCCRLRVFGCYEVRNWFSGI